MAKIGGQMPLSDTVIEKGSYTNEDRLTVLDQAAWVLDGTSGFSERSLTDHPESDGVWFVEVVDAYLREHVLDDAPLETIIAGAIDHVVEELQADISIEPGVNANPPRMEDAVSIHEIPGAMVGLVRWNEDTLEYYSLGDSSVMIRTHDDFAHYNEGGPQHIDTVLQGRAREYLSDHPDASPDEVRAELMPHIRESRQFRGVPGGFWTLGVNPISAKQALQGEYPVEEVTDVYLFTDGLLNAVDLFGLFEDWKAVADFIDDEGVDYVVERLRTVQEGDETMVGHPRLKPMDDVALVHLDFAAELSE